MFTLIVASSGREVRIQKSSTNSALRVAFALAKQHGCAVDVLDDAFELVTTASVDSHGRQLRDAA